MRLASVARIRNAAQSRRVRSECRSQSARRRPCRSREHYSVLLLRVQSPRRRLPRRTRTLPAAPDAGVGVAEPVGGAHTRAACSRRAHATQSAPVLRQPAARRGQAQRHERASDRLTARNCHGAIAPATAAALRLRTRRRCEAVVCCR